MLDCASSLSLRSSKRTLISDRRRNSRAVSRSQRAGRQRGRSGDEDDSDAKREHIFSSHINRTVRSSVTYSAPPSPIPVQLEADVDIRIAADMGAGGVVHGVVDV